MEQLHRPYITYRESVFVIWVVFILNILLSVSQFLDFQDVYLSEFWPWWFAASAVFVGWFATTGIQNTTEEGKLAYVMAGAMTVLGLVGRASDVALSYWFGELTSYNDPWRVPITVGLYLAFSSVLFVLWRAIGRMINS